ncbi:hypothetical protein D9M71_691920 [compost metagenome]
MIVKYLPRLVPTSLFVQQQPPEVDLRKIQAQPNFIFLPWLNKGEYLRQTGLTQRTEPINDSILLSGFFAQDFFND